MKITAATLMRRRTHGPYEHEEITLVAELHEGTSKETSQQLRELGIIAHKALYPESYMSAEPSHETVTEEVTLKPLANEPAATANFVKEKKPKGAKATASTLENGQAIPPVINQEAAPSENTGGASKVVGSVDTANVTTVQSEGSKTATPVIGKGEIAYDSKIKEHRSRFATYLGTTFPKWKPDTQFGVADSADKAAYADKVRVFSGNLHGKAFEDAKGNMLDSFKAELEAFFGHTNK